MTAPQSISVELRLRQRAVKEFEDAKSPTMFEIVGGGMVAAPPAPAPAATAVPATAAVADSNSKKRPRDESADVDGDGVVDLLDDDDGVPEKRAHT